MRLRVLIQPIGEIDFSLVREIAEAFSRAIEVYLDVSEQPLPAPRGAYNILRAQYRSEAILDLLRRHAASVEHDRVLGLADFDAYAKGTNFVFGQAELGGRVGVVYLARLRPEFYGEPPDRGLLVERAAKELLHELGHTLGLRHCPDKRCVMSFSNNIWEADFKEAAFCNRCASQLSMIGIKVRRLP